METLGSDQFNSASTVCRVHSNAAESLICVNCSSVCCSDCLRLEDNIHRNHRVLKPLVARRLFESEYAQSLQQLTKFRNELIVIRDGRFVSSTNVERQLATIQRDFESRKTKIESCINELEQLLASQYSERLLQIIRRSQKPTRFEELLLREQEHALTAAIEKAGDLLSASSSMQDVIGFRPAMQRQFKELERRQARLPSAHAEFPEFKVRIDTLDKLLARIDSELEWFRKRLRLPIESPDRPAVVSMSVDDVDALKESNASSSSSRRAMSVRSRPSTTALASPRHFGNENLMNNSDLFSGGDYIPLSPGCVIAKSLVESNGDLICLKRFAKHKLLIVDDKPDKPDKQSADNSGNNDNKLSKLDSAKTLAEKQERAGALQICNMSYMQLAVQHRKPLPADETFTASLFRNQVLVLCDRTNRCLKLLELDTDRVFTLCQFEDTEPLAVVKMGDYCTAVMKQLDIDAEDPASTYLQNEQHFAVLLLKVDTAKLYFVHYEFDQAAYFKQRREIDDAPFSHVSKLEACFNQAQVIGIDAENLREDLPALTIISPWSISEAYLPAKSTEKGYADSASFEVYSLLVSIGGLQVLEFRLEMRASEQAFSENPNEVRRANFRFSMKKKHGTLSESLRFHAKIHAQVNMNTSRNGSRSATSRSPAEQQQQQATDSSSSFDEHAMGITSVACGAPWFKQVAVAFGDGSVRLFALDRKIVHIEDRATRKHGTKTIRGTKFAAQMTMKYTHTISARLEDATDKNVPLRSSTLKYLEEHILRADRHKMRIDRITLAGSKVRPITTRPINVTSWCLLPFPGIGDKLHEPIRLAIFDQLTESIGLYLVHLSE